MRPQLLQFHTLGKLYIASKSEAVLEAMHKHSRILSRIKLKWNGLSKPDHRARVWLWAPALECNCFFVSLLGIRKKKKTLSQRLSVYLVFLCYANKTGMAAWTVEWDCWLTNLQRIDTLPPLLIVASWCHGLESNQVSDEVQPVGTIWEHFSFLNKGSMACRTDWVSQKDISVSKMYV